MTEEMILTGRGWTSAKSSKLWVQTKAFADQCTQHELDALSYRKPVEVISHGAGNVGKLPLASDELCCCV